MGLQNDIYHAQLLVHRNGEVTRHPAGRFFVKDGNMQVLEDYHDGLIGKTIPEGPIDDLTVHKINNCGPHLSVASHHDLTHGHRLDFIKEHPLDNMLPDPPGVMGLGAPPVEPPKPPSVFHYTRVGHDQPHVLEVKGGKHLLDGNPLAPDEIATILDNVRTKTARLRYAKQAPQAITKMEKSFEDMKKAEGEMDPQDALAHLDQLNGADEKTKGAVAALRRHLFEDPMNPGVGNKYAYEQFRQKNQPGVWTSMDVNDLKHLNDTQGHDAGDSLIRGFGSAARKGVEPGDGKLFRAGGDEYVMWHPTPDAAHLALRNIRNHVDQIPPINGTHRVSFSAGIGQDFNTADKALYQAKAQKLNPMGMRAFKPGQTPHFAHSLLPGGEGPVPLDPEQKTVSPPKMPEMPEPPKLQTQPLAAPSS